MMLHAVGKAVGVGTEVVRVVAEIKSPAAERAICTSMSTEYRERIMQIHNGETEANYEFNAEQTARIV
jgi:hypothetical protein